ncbi:hypothetical protein [Brevibacillus laterosporus]|uniref:Uncharacterized protein n=1 Tax=Brevibacillus laterosporus TaxID=1465 RepID=A0AAP3G9J0_BRELA|nr:hypothetical protein [Brevibacillus laterosporus]MCR8982472.1 hypothetical protein [Brevibacillus laterosporus]MCZ0809628.1 hypothetical protein [Brevibacillus laterosporus]MCZ0828161.1 hypothetical protein [Brevibacillus laterosporus]MCZ0852215.1 hypothetical protein [Brevibacillus laterosporus]MED1666895.1 hypothetical protein [Brevibacillus laterosporus]
MSKRKWRNPYVTINKKPSRPSANKAKTKAKGNVNIAVQEPVVKEFSQKKGLLSKLPSLDILSNLDLRTSVTKVRSNIKGISTTIRQMEDTMESIFGAMEMLDSFRKVNKTENVKTASEIPPQKKQQHESAFLFEDEEEIEEEAPVQENTSNPFSGLDIGQLLGLLQSPLVQSLLTQSSNDSGKRKKEG